MTSTYTLHRLVLAAGILAGTAIVAGCGGPDQVTTTDRTMTTTTAPAPAYQAMPPASSTTTTTHTEQPAQ